MSNTRGGIRYHQDSKKVQVLTDEGIWMNINNFESEAIPLIPRMDSLRTLDNSITIRTNNKIVNGGSTGGWIDKNNEHLAYFSGGGYSVWNCTQHENDSQFAATGNNVYWQICFNRSKVYIDHFELRSPTSGLNEENWTNSNCQFTLQGSDDGIYFTQITPWINCWTDTGDATARTKLFDLQDRLDSSPYYIYRIQFNGLTHPGSSTSNGAGFSDIQFYGYYVK